jgi:hypothetical protein
MGFKKGIFNIWAVRACPRKRGGVVELPVAIFCKRQAKGFSLASLTQVYIKIGGYTSIL